MISNARVLTEGVDVPALDAVVFLAPRKSKIDIVQAVGRVMRTCPGKKIGYIVIPVVVPEGKAVTDTEVLDSSDFDVVWDVVRALRSHDERMDMWVNHIDAARNSQKISLITRGTDQPLNDNDETVDQFRFLLDERIASKMVQRCGDRKMWPSWGVRAAGVCRDVREKVDTQLAIPETAAAFDSFVQTMRAVVGDRLTAGQAAEMVAQHIVTIPIFDCLFAESQFARSNPVAVAINTLLESFAAACDPAGIEPAALFEDELRPLTRAYRAMQSVFDGALTPAAKVDVLREVYDGFFKAAMNDVVKQLGVVYTPVEVVDFIIRSADAVCREEFEVGLTSEDVNILDGFTGTGTFAYRVLTATDSDGNHIIRDEDLHRKYGCELFANEMVLLAYYVAAIKIEAGMAERGGFAAGKFNPFPGIAFSDTFLETATDGSQLSGMGDNIAHQSHQSDAPITVIVTNPPWSAGQKSTGDDNPKIDHPQIENRVRDTYGKRHREVTGLGAGKSAGNLYVQAIRWASDRLTKPGTVAGSGVIAMVHPNSLTAGTTLSGMRAALRDEFTDIYVVNLRGDAIKSGDEFNIEGAKIFGQGSRSGVQITVLARNPARDRPNGAVVHYAAVPERCTLDQKFAWLTQLGDVTSDQLTEVPLDKSHNWVNLTDGTFHELMRVCATSREPQDELLSHVSAGGVMTACDPYVYAFDYDELVNKTTKLVDVYDSALARVRTAQQQQDNAKTRQEHTQAHQGLEAEITLATTNTERSLRVVKWTGKLKHALRRGDVIEFDASRVRQVLYRPFAKIWMYEDERILDKVEAVSSLTHDTSPAEFICVAAPNNRTIFGAVATDCLMDLCSVGTNQPARTIPRWKQPPPNAPSSRAQLATLAQNMTNTLDLGLIAQDDDNITDWALEQFQTRYGSHITKDAIWEYAYGVMHAPDWRDRYRHDLQRNLPRIPLADNFETFRSAGRCLMDLHINYETIDEWPVECRVDDKPDEGTADPDAYRIENKMRWSSNPDTSDSRDDRSVLRINTRCCLTNIPTEAENYKISGRSPLRWAIDSLRVKHDTASGIVDDPNGWHAWTDEPFNLIRHLRRLVTVSVESARLVASLPPSLPTSSATNNTATSEQQRGTR